MSIDDSDVTSLLNRSEFISYYLSLIKLCSWVQIVNIHFTKFLLCMLECQFYFFK